MEKEINENIIEIEGKKYKFIEAEKSICCKSCDLRKDRRCHLLHRMCISDNRKDKKEGYFKRIEETTIENKNIMTTEELEKNKNQDNPQEFRVGDEVIDIITRQRGKIFKISTNDDDILPIYVSSNKGEEVYTVDGRYYANHEYPRLLHYRDDYDYDVIDFNNLPERQEPKRWRAKVGGEYHYIRFYLEGWFSISFTDENNKHRDNINYNSGNYFRTIVEAEIIAQKLNTYFKQLIQEEHERN